MSWLLALALFAVGWLLVDSGMQFLGFLLIIAGLLALILPRRSRHARAVASAAPAPAGYYSQPVITRSSPAPPIQQVDLRLKEVWWGTRNYEDFFERMSTVVLWPFKVLWRLLRIGGGGGKKK